MRTANSTPSSAATGQSSTNTSGPATTRTTSSARLVRGTSLSLPDTSLLNLVTNMRPRDTSLQSVSLSAMKNPLSRSLNSDSTKKSNHSLILVHFNENTKYSHNHSTRPSPLRLKTSFVTSRGDPPPSSLLRTVCWWRRHFHSEINL